MTIEIKNESKEKQHVKSVRRIVTRFAWFPTKGIGWLKYYQVEQEFIHTPECHDCCNILTPCGWESHNFWRDI